MLRIIWGALLMGQIMFLAVVLTIGPKQEKPDPSMSNVLLYAAVAMLATTVPIAFVVRSIIYRKGQTDAGVEAGAYATGNIIFWAMCEGCGFFGLVGGLLNQGRGPHLFVAAVAIALIVVNFPTGAIMRKD